MNTTDPECQRAAAMLDTLIKNGTTPNISVFSSEFVKKYCRQGPHDARTGLVRGRHLQQRTLKIPAGQLGGGAAAAVAGRGESDVGQRRRWHLVRQQPLEEPQGRRGASSRFATTADEYQVRVRARLSGVRARRREVGEEAGVERLLRQRPAGPVVKAAAGRSGPAGARPSSARRPSGPRRSPRAIDRRQEPGPRCSRSGRQRSRIRRRSTDTPSNDGCQAAAAVAGRSGAG